MGKKPSGGVPVKLRRKNVIDRLQAQLLSGVKINNGVEKPLTDGNIKRINNEIVTLKSRV